MKTVVRVFYILGLLFWGSFLLYSSFKILVLNGVGSFFEMKEPIHVDYIIRHDATDTYIDYKYWVDDNLFSGGYVMFTDYYFRCNLDTIIIKYNSILPKVSYIEGLPLKIRKHKIEFVFSSLFILFFLLVWRFGDKEKWIRFYQGKLWMKK